MRLPGRLERHTEFIGHVATLVSGRTAAAAVALLTMPIVSRLFLPSDFGVAALFVSIISICAPVASLRYEAALVLPKEKHEAATLMSIAYRLLFWSCIVILLFLAAYKASGATLSALELLGPWKWALPMGVLLMGAIRIQESWLTRTKSFKVASASLVVGNATTGGTRIGFGALSGSTVYGLIMGNILGMILRLVVQKSASREGFRVLSSRVSWQAMKALAHRYADFPKLNAPAALVFTLGQNLPVLMFGVMFAPAVAGYYSMANQLVRAPVNTVASSTRKVFLQKAASIRNQGRSLQKAFLLSTTGLALLGTPALILLLLFGEPLATWFLGSRWTIAGEYLEIIAPWLFIIWVMAPCNPIFVVLREQRLWLSLQLLLTVARLSVFGIAYVLHAGPDRTLRAFVLVTVVANLLMWATAYILIRKHGPGGLVETGTDNG